jgi:glycosyltransferase involved in cell wall biosynthesis
MKISVLSSNLSNNCLGRAFVLAKVLARHYEVEIIGPVTRAGIWPPCDTREIAIKPLEWVAPNNLWSTLRPALRAIEGDVTYAVKPLLASYGVALAKRLVSKTPVVVDIDDWQLGFTTKMEGYFDLRRIRARLSGLRTSSNSYYWVALMERLTRWADDITTVSSVLNGKFGNRGIIVPHGRDPALFDPQLYDRESLRRRHGLDPFKVIMFLGTPKPHKGIEDIIAAVRTVGRSDIRVVIVGADRSDGFVEGLCAQNEELVIPFGLIPFSDIPRFLSMADLVVLPQKNEPRSVGQIPAKLIDAMAMAKPIVATAVSDIGKILQGCGIVVEPGAHGQLAASIEFALGDPEAARELGRKARERFLAEYSFDVMEHRLVATFAKYANRAGCEGPAVQSRRSPPASPRRHSHTGAS